MANPTNPAKTSLETQMDADCALVAFFTGLARHDDGNGQALDLAWDHLNSFVALGIMTSEDRGAASPLVGITDDGFGIIEDIIEDGEFDLHVARINRERFAFAGRAA